MILLIDVAVAGASVVVAAVHVAGVLCTQIVALWRTQWRRQWRRRGSINWQREMGGVKYS